MQAANRKVLSGTQAFERGLENDALLGRSLRPSAQLLMTTWLRAGNERVYPGRDGWLFFRPDVEYLTGRGFLDPSQLAKRRASGSEVTAAIQPDPRIAIMSFRRELEARGITLIVVPTPVKPGVHPEQLDRRLDGPPAAVLQNRSYDAFIAERVTLASTADPDHRLDRVEVANTGDAARMLALPASSPLVAPESVWLRRVIRADRSAWRPSRDADVLVLGDSFSNIYSLESMGWGTSAGFVEQLSYTLRRAVDRIVQNDEGAFATRRMLGQDPDRLTGKRVVIYQFAARELAFGDWRK